MKTTVLLLEVAGAASWGAGDIRKEKKTTQEEWERNKRKSIIKFRVFTNCKPKL